MVLEETFSHVMAIRCLLQCCFFEAAIIMLKVMKVYKLQVLSLLSSADNFPQMAHQKRFIERKYRQELKEMRRERERQERDSDEG